MMTASPVRRRAAERGLSMILVLIFMVVMSTLALSMFRSFGLLELIAGNTMDKQRAFEASQSALRYGEWWLDSLGQAPLPVTCTGVVDANAAATLPVCDNALAQIDRLPWTPSRIDYTPPDMTVLAGGGVNGAGDINYQSRPALYIQYLGTQPDGVGQVYRITATGAGGHAATVSVVESAFELNSPVKNLGSP